MSRNRINIQFVRWKKLDTFASNKKEQLANTSVAGQKINKYCPARQYAKIHFPPFIIIFFAAWYKLDK